MRQIIMIQAVLQLILSYINANLIRFGDFQNLTTISIANRTYKSCGNICNNAWFASRGIIQVFNTEVLPSKHRTMAVEMQNDNYFQLCQNVSSIQIGKIYKYSFDIFCRNFHESCSIWVILDNKVVNGSNYTSTDFIPHTAVGYINATAQNSKICFQSRESPFRKAVGSRIDNITLQLYSGIIPCYISGCKSCTLNFPNFCQVCKSNYVKQSNQACIACSSAIAGCIRCESVSNKYLCLQCSSQLFLKKQKTSCLNKSVIYFSSKVQETTSIDNSFLIQTNLSLALLSQAGFTVYNLPSISIRINNQRQQQVEPKINEQGLLQFKVNIQQRFQTFQITLQIQQELVIINNIVCSFKTSVDGIASTVFFTEFQLQVMQKYDELASPVLQQLDAIFSIMKNSGIGFFITNIFNYLNLMTFYGYLKINQPKSFKIFIQSLVTKLNQFSFYRFINLQDQVYQIGYYQVREKIQQSKSKWSGPLQAGFSTNFYQNNLEPCTIIATTTLRIVIVWLLNKIIKVAILQQFSSQKFVSFSTQFHTIVPIIILPSSNLIIKQIASQNYIQKINTMMHITVLFVCILITFFHLISQIQQAQIKMIKQRKKISFQIKKYKKGGVIQDLLSNIEYAELSNSQILKALNEKLKQIKIQQKNRIVEAKYSFFKRLVLVSIPVLVISEQVIPFLIINLGILTVNFLLLLKLRAYFTNYQLFLKLTTGFVWLIYHSSFCFYYAAQQFFFGLEQTNYQEQVSKYLGFATIIFVLVGAFVEIIDCLIGIFQIFKQIFMFLFQKFQKSNKIDPKIEQTPQQIEQQLDVIYNAQNLKVAEQKTKLNNDLQINKIMQKQRKCQEKQINNAKRVKIFDTKQFRKHFQQLKKADINDQNKLIRRIKKTRQQTNLNHLKILYRC